MHISESNISFTQKTSDVSLIEKHLQLCDALFVPLLSNRVSIQEYSEKIFRYAETFEAWKDDSLVGLLAVYMNNGQVAFITSVSVLKQYAGKGIASRLLDICIAICKDLSYSEIRLEVENSNFLALKLYGSKEFQLIAQSGNSFTMRKILN